MIRKAASFFSSFGLEKTPSKMAKVEVRHSLTYDLNVCLMPMRWLR